MGGTAGRTRSTARRWAPALLGLALAGGVALSYEAGWIEAGAGSRESADCPPPPAPQQADDQGSGEGPRPSAIAPASQRRAELDAVDLRERVATLESQAKLMAERNVTGELPYYGHTPAELEAMARHCDVRVDYPTRLETQAIEDLGLDEAESRAWERALEAFAAEELGAYRALLRELAPDTPELDALPLAQVRRLLTRLVPRTRSEDDGALRRHVARERAGLREPPASEEKLSAYNRYNRLRFSAGDRFATFMADELGSERAAELRAAYSGWPGARTRQWGCEDEADTEP